MNENRVGESIKRTNLLLADERLYDDGNFVRSELRSGERASLTREWIFAIGTHQP